MDESLQTVTTSIHTQPHSSFQIPALHFSAPLKRTFKRSRILIGRSPACDLVIDNHFVSSQHAEIFFHEGTYMIRDLHSRNGTFVNDFRITEKPLASAGILRLGKMSLPYQIETSHSVSPDKIPGISLPPLSTAIPQRKLVGQSESFLNTIQKLKKIAPTADPVLLLGETGVGKDLFAQLLHAENPRKNGPFVVVNCATIPQNLAESQLFGHVRGAFSGAINDQKGFFREADGGTLFLDEVGDLPLESQARLLRVIEDGVIRPLGAQKELHINVRLVLATNRNLNEARSAGQFREDLFQRFQWVIPIPPLRERLKDIPLLTRYFVQQHSPVPLTIDQSVYPFLEKASWPGNIRALNRAVRRAITNATARNSNILLPEDFEGIENSSQPRQMLSESRTAETRDQKRKSLRETLKNLGGNISHASKALGISRVTLHKWIQEDGIDVGGLRE